MSYNSPRSSLNGDDFGLPSGDWGDAPVRSMNRRSSEKSVVVPEFHTYDDPELYAKVRGGEVSRPAYPDEGPSHATFAAAARFKDHGQPREPTSPMPNGYNNRADNSPSRPPRQKQGSSSTLDASNSNSTKWEGGQRSLLTSSDQHPYPPGRSHLKITAVEEPDYYDAEMDMSGSRSRSMPMRNLPRSNQVAPVYGGSPDQPQGRYPPEGPMEPIRRKRSMTPTAAALRRASSAIKASKSFFKRGKSFDNRKHVMLDGGILKHSRWLNDEDLRQGMNPRWVEPTSASLDDSGSGDSKKRKRKVNFANLPVLQKTTKDENGAVIKIEVEEPKSFLKKCRPSYFITNRPVLASNSPVKRVWTLIRSLTMLLTFFRMFVYIAFPTQLENLYPMLDSIDIFVVIDMIVTLFSPYYIATSGIVLTEPKDIFRAYFDMFTAGYWNPKDPAPKKTFWIDVLAVLPFHIVKGSFLSAPSENAILGIETARYFTLLHYPFTMEVFHTFRRLETDIHQDVQRIALFKFLVFMGMGAHAFGCVWWFIASIYDFNCHTWVGQYTPMFLDPDEEYLESVLGSGAAATFEEDKCYDELDTLKLYKIDTLMEAYELAFFWGWNSLTNLGYSDVVPDNPIELTWTALLLLFQVMFYSYILALGFNFIFKKDEKEENHKRMLRTLELYGQTRNLPPDLRARLKKYFDFQQIKKDSENDEELISEMPTNILIEFCACQYSPFIQRSVIFKGLSPQFTNSLMTKLRQKYLMPNEVLFKIEDMSREMGFITQGSVHVYSDLDCKQLVKQVTEDSHFGSQVGEVAFFMNMPQPFQVRASGESDVSLLTLSKADYETCINSYPESHGTIISTVLAIFGLNNVGEDIDKGSSDGMTGMMSVVADDDELFKQIKEDIRTALVKRNEEALGAMIDFASQGEVDEVKKMLAQGLDVNSGDYDSRTTLHLAAAEGNLRVVQVLLQEGADVQVTDRWGHEPLHDAITSKHESVAELLAEQGAELHYDDPAGMLCSAAAAGDVDQLNRMVTHGISPNSADYDGRTALHLAASEGNMKVVEMLISNANEKANVNVQDRWNNTPLDDAVSHGHELISMLLSESGGKMNLAYASGALCDASAKGNIIRLKLLQRHGADVKDSDYDDRTALHLAAAEGQLVSVDFLLNSKADVNFKDRWGRVALDDSVAGKHYEVAKLIMSAGGEPSEPLDEEDIKIINAVDLRKVREICAATVESQNDRHQRNTQLIELTKQMTLEAQSATNKVQRAVKNVEHVMDAMGSSALQHLPSMTDSRQLSLTVYDEKAINAHFSLLEIHTPSTKFGNNADNKVGESFALDRFLSGGGTTQTVPQLSFNSFHQVILQFTQIEASLNTLKADFERFATARKGFVEVEDEIGARELYTLLASYELEANKVTIEKILLEANTTEETAGRGQAWTSQFDDNLAQASSMKTSFKNLLKSPTLCNLFIGHSHFQNSHTSKIAHGFRVINAAFNLLDTDSDGKLAVSQLMSMKDVFGTEDGISNDEIRNSFFSNKKHVFKYEFPIIMAKLVGVLETDAEVVDSDDDSGLDDMSDNWSDDDEHHEDGMDSSGGEEEGGKGYLKKKGKKKRKKGQSSAASAVSSIASSKNDEDKKKRNRWITCIKDSLSNLFWTVENFLPAGCMFSMRQIDQKILDKLQIQGTYAKQYEEAFQSIDDDDSGNIDRDEFEKLIKIIFDVEIPTRYRVKLFHRFDRQGLGVITFDDFSYTLRNMLETRMLTLSRREVERRLENIVIPEGTPWYILHPRSNFCEIYWKNVMVIVSIFYLWLVPHTIAFLSTSPNEVYITIPNVTTFHWNRLFLFLDVFLWADILFKFVTAYQNKRSVYIFKREKVMKNYLKNNFVFDALTAAPLDIFLEATGGSKRNVAWVKLLRLFRMASVRREIRHHQHVKQDALSDMVGHGFTLMVVLHLLACIWYYVSIVSMPADGTSYLHNKNMEYDGYGSLYRLNRTATEIEFKFDEWALSFYWCFGTLSAMGAGDLLPSSPRERLVVGFIMMLNLSLYAYFLGAMSAMFMSRDETLVQNKSEVASIQRFIEKRNLPKKLEKDIRETFEFKAHQKATGISQDQETDVYRSLSHTLQVEVAHYISRGLLNGVNALKDCNPNFLDSLSTVLREETIAPSNYIFEMNDNCKTLYILSFGELRILTFDPEEQTMVPVEVMSPGAVAGEMEFFFGLRHQTSCETLSNGVARLFTLSRDEYNNLTKLYPNDEDIINKNILTMGDVEDGKSVRSKVSRASSAMSSYSGFSDKKSDTGSKASGKSGTALETESNHSRDSKYSAASFMSFATSLGENHMNGINLAQKKKEMERIIQLCSLCHKGNLEGLRKLLGKDRLTDEGDYDKRTPLHLAASEGKLSCVEFLCEHMDSEFLSPVDRFGGTPLSDAVRHKNDKVANFLRNKGAKMPESTDRAGELCAAAADKDLDQLKRLVANMYDPNEGDYDDRTAIHLAASNGHLGIVKYLHSMWADLNCIDRWGGTPLADAIRHDHKEVAEYLRKNGGRLPDDMDVAGMMCQAASEGDIEQLRTFFINGVNLNLGDYDARTALHLACSCNQLAVVDFLLKECKNSVDVNPIDRLGNTPLDDCERECFDWLAIIIKKYGGVKKGNKILADKVKALEADQQKRLDDKVVTLQKEMKLDIKNVEIMAILKDAIASINETVPKLRGGLDFLLYGLSRTKRQLSKKIISRSRVPTLDELCDFFTSSIFNFMREHQKINEINAWVTVRSIIMDGSSINRLCAATRLYIDTHISSEAGQKISVNPEDKLSLIKCLKKLERNQINPEAGYNRNTEKATRKKLMEALTSIKKSLQVQLSEMVTKYYKSHEYISASRGRLGRAWRCLIVSQSMFENTFHLLKRIDKLKMLAALPTTDQGPWDMEDTKKKEAKDGKKEELKEAFSEVVKSHELRKHLAENSNELINMFRHVGNIAIRAGRITKEFYAAYQHKANIIDMQKNNKKKKDSKFGKGLGSPGVDVLTGLTKKLQDGERGGGGGNSAPKAVPASPKGGSPTADRRAIPNIKEEQTGSPTVGDGQAPQKRRTLLQGDNTLGLVAKAIGS
ncbi:hypothetical protein TrST_g8567 [Triparma strigata]|uniref:Calmodulin n=1 Tax=Triparma strigata TaxID=1606541 RepID=A0A9W6ZF53_9STRA|nr:hypothetical protein TrST_g8567 [Triparma strigata]